MPLIREPRSFIIIPNIFFEHWIKILSSQEFKIFMFLFYFNESNPTNKGISFKDLSSKLNMNISSVVLHVNKLVDQSLIHKVKVDAENGANLCNMYSISKSVIGGDICQ